MSSELRTAEISWITSTKRTPRPSQTHATFNCDAQLDSFETQQGFERDTNLATSSKSLALDRCRKQPVAWFCRCTRFSWSELCHVKWIENSWKFLNYKHEMHAPPFSDTRHIQLWCSTRFVWNTTRLRKKHISTSSKSLALVAANSRLINLQVHSIKLKWALSCQLNWEQLKFLE